MLSLGPSRDFDLFLEYLVRVVATPLYEARSGRFYPGAQVVRVEHRNAPATFTM